MFQESDNIACVFSILFLKLFLFLQMYHFLENEIVAMQKVLRLLEILWISQQNISATFNIPFVD